MMINVEVNSEPTISVGIDSVITQTGGGGGTTDYNRLSNKPKINDVELSGNKTTSDLGIFIPTKTSDLTNDSGFLTEHQSLSAYRTSAEQDVIDNAKEATSNKVTSISSSSTDTEYPSAKCVYDIVGNVESLLEALL